MKKAFLIAGCCLLALLLIAGGIFLWLDGQNDYTLLLTMDGAPSITLSHGETFQDPGARATVSGSLFPKQPISVKVTCQGQVDTSRAGTYTLVYQAKYRGFTQEKLRTVTVVDNMPPMLTLMQDPEIFTLPGQLYNEEGYSAIDLHDGDITDRVIVKEEKGIVTYTVSDAAGNTVQAERTVVYSDPLAPELTLAGSGMLFAPLGSTFKEPGFRAVDNYDGDLTETVTVTGKVDTCTPGSYPLTYTVTDTHGNTATETRIITVPPLDLDNLPEPNGKVIYLTFDDGPSADTPRLLEILKKYNIKATFFMVGTSYISTCAQIAEDGHTLAIHSATHDFRKIYASESAFFDDLYRMQDIIESYTGQSPTIIRFPGGSSNTISGFNPGIMSRLAKRVEEKGFRYFDWNVSSGDGGGTYTADQVFRNVTQNVPKNNVSFVLQHDTQSHSIDAVERIIIWGLSNGYTFLPITEDTPNCHHGINN